MVSSAIAAVLDCQVRTAAMARFNGIFGRVATAGSTIRLPRSSSERRSHSGNGLSIYAFLRFKRALDQLRQEIDVTYKTVYQRVQRSHEALDTPALDLVDPVEID
jgi:hypothetical protein